MTSPATAPPARIAPGAVKIDGLRDLAHARAAVLAGADLVGFIFAPARRRVTPEEARACLEAARAAAGARSVLGVGVFVDAPATEVNAVADAVGIDVVQLHGEEPPDFLAKLTRPALKAFRPTEESSTREVVAAFARYRAVPNAPIAFLLDGYSPRAAGGEGVRANWGVAAEAARGDQVMLAGGLTPENVAEAIALVRPLAVDVSSGVETDGVKDPAKIAAFVAAAKAAFAAASAPND